MDDHKALGTEEAAEGLHGQAEGTDLVVGLGDGFGWDAQLDEAADGDAHQFDFLIDADGAGGFDFGQVGGLKLARIEAMGGGVDIAGLAAALAGRRWIGQGGTSGGRGMKGALFIIVHMFYFVKHESLRG